MPPDRANQDLHPTESDEIRPETVNPNTLRLRCRKTINQESGFGNIAMNRTGSGGRKINTERGEGREERERRPREKKPKPIICDAPVRLWISLMTAASVSIVWLSSKTNWVVLARGAAFSPCYLLQAFFFVAGRFSDDRNSRDRQCLFIVARHSAVIQMARDLRIRAAYVRQCVTVPSGWDTTSRGNRPRGSRERLSAPYTQ